MAQETSYKKIGSMALRTGAFVSFAGGALLIGTMLHDGKIVAQKSKQLDSNPTYAGLVAEEKGLNKLLSAMQKAEDVEEGKLRFRIQKVGKGEESIENQTFGSTREEAWMKNMVEGEAGLLFAVIGTGPLLARILRKKETEYTKEPVAVIGKQSL